jgi:uncharacterized protein (TIGR01319 family)
MENRTERKRLDFSTARHILITDVGSTTTKAILLSRTSEGLVFAGSTCFPTTVEKPTEDVCCGVRMALGQLATDTGTEITDAEGNPIVPFITTSSAGGGLQILVFGLTSVETGRVAEVAAYGAGGVILGTMTIDDGTPAVDKMKLMRDLHPDIVLMAGGFDGGAIANVVNLAELLTLADPKPKFRQNMRIPLVFCGNKDARSFVSNVLEETFEVHMTENVRPSGMVMNLAPAREMVHRLFMDNVMERAPGYSELKGMVSADIIPTPAGVENILRLYGETPDESTLMMDMGGATTDIFSNIIGSYHRTVAANTGMSYSLSNIMSQCGIESVMCHLPAGFPESAVRDYIANKTLYPTYIPESSCEVSVEHALAIEGTSIAWNHHLDINFQTARLGFLDRLKANTENICKFEQQFLTSEEVPFYISDICTIIGSGGVIAHAGNMDIMRILSEGFRPHGITRLVVDRHFRSPHMGVLATVAPADALDLFRKECLEDIGYVVAPVGDIRKGRHALEVIEGKSGKSWRLDGGEFMFFESGGSLELIPADGTSFGKDEGARELVTDLPVLIDTRGRGEKSLDIPLVESGIPQFAPQDGACFSSSITPGQPRIEAGEFEIECRLPYEGTVLVRRGEEVNPGDVLGENRYAPPRLYILDLNRITGYDRHLTPEELSSGLLVWTGDEVSLGQAVFRVCRPGITGFDFVYHSPVRGKITRIEKSGIIILREIQDYDGKPHVVDVAGQLGIRPSRMRGHLSCRKGDFISADQTIARDVARGIFVTSPTSGVVKGIDTDAGTVTVQYDIRPVLMRSYVKGKVKDVREGSAVTIRTIGTRLEGVIGFGGQNYGRLVLIPDNPGEKLQPGSVVVSREPIGSDLLRRAEAAGVTGIVAPSIPNLDWVEFYGEEIGVALTGDESIPFTLILTEGFGSFEMNEASWSFLSSCPGSSVSLSGRTQIRAGVIRPHLIVCD